MNKTILLIALCGATIFPGCHKSSHDASSTTKCKITGIHVAGHGWSSDYIIAYDNAGRPTALQFSQNGGGYTANFAYGDHLIVVTTTGTSNTIDSVFLNANGDIDHLIVRNGSSNTITDVFTYDSKHQLSKSVEQGGADVTTLYQYSNGDMVEADLPGEKFIYSYYTDKPAAVGDPMVLTQWLQFGALFQRSAHLTKTQSVGSNVETFTYTFDAEGKIASVTEADGSVDSTTFTYTYECH
jgi:hypothetical protein